MSDILTLALACLLGGALGAIFFGGLWWTVRRAASAERPALWFSASLLLRTAIVLLGFHFVSCGDWRRLMLCLLGFLLGRMLVLRMTRPLASQRPPPGQEASHAPQS